MSQLKPDSVIACLDCPDHVQAVLDASLWAAARMQAPIALLHAVPSLQQKAAVDYSGCLNINDESHLLDAFTNHEQLSNAQLKLKAKALLSQAEAYCEEQQHKRKVYALHRHDSLVDSLDYVDNYSKLAVIGHKLTCKTSLAQLIRMSHCPILVTHKPFVAPTQALFAFDNRATARRMLAWLCKTPLIRALTVHIVMVGKDTPENNDALREAYAKLKQSGIACKKALIDGRDVTQTLQRYQIDHNIGLLMTGAFGQSRLLELIQGSNTKKMLEATLIPYLLFPKVSLDEPL